MTNSELAADIAICGAGPVGMALAILLVKRGVAARRIALIDARALPEAVTDPRSLALSYGSVQQLEQAGAWPLPATAIHQIHISRRGHFGRALMDRAAHQLPALGYVTRYGELVAALAAAAATVGLHMLRPARVQSITEDADGVSLQLGDGRLLRASVAIQAEGGVFGQQTPRALKRAYDQTAIIARVAVSAPIAHRAFERFTDEGPLALLPQEGSDGLQYALVWCAHPDRVAQLLALDDAAFLARLGTMFGTRLGHFSAISPRASYPLGLNADAAASARTIAIGNAAQTLHPVAGQGLNLGLRDAAVLARLLAVAATPAQLQAFGAARQPDRQLTVRLTDTMATIFANRGPLQSLLGLGLGAIDAVAPARHLMADLMMYGRR
ncbi:FAD-dependent monooxygenase [Massilia sp. PWRC2]|uniref:FAD-dependent monooxygenase n=1 Tax=Massilia sp. PWRC2 TaxID=2804626 RepID=UPI003CFA3591